MQGVKSPLIIFSYIVISQEFYGSWCSPFFGIQWVNFETIRETLLEWHDSFVGGRFVKAWRTTPLCIFWII